jgi:cytochrome b6-f complex iron-sulfur subunit
VTPCSRRCVVAGGLALAACGATTAPPDESPLDEPMPDAGALRPDAGVLDEACAHRAPSARALRLELGDFPTLRAPGGAAAVQRPDELLNVWVLHLPNGCFTAVWRVCTHGACDVTPREGRELFCPCHGSRFALDGRVLEGPATRALRTFTVTRDGDALFLERG